MLFFLKGCYADYMDRSKIELIRSLRVYLLTCVQEKFSKQETEIFIDFLDELLETQIDTPHA